MVLWPPTKIEVGLAVRFITSQGSKETFLPATPSQPLGGVLPTRYGPPLQPHQLLVARTGSIESFSTPTPLPAIRLPEAITSVVSGPSVDSIRMPASLSRSQFL